jgi:hypothetical protein
VGLASENEIACIAARLFMVIFVDTASLVNTIGIENKLALGVDVASLAAGHCSPHEKIGKMGSRLDAAGESDASWKFLIRSVSA